MSDRDSLLNRLAGANPQPNPQLTDAEFSRAEQALEELLARTEPASAAASRTGQPRRLFLVAAAVLVLGGVAIPLWDLGNAPSAVAETLSQAASSSLSQPSLLDGRPTNVKYQERSDATANAQVHTVSEASAGGALTRTVTADGELPPELVALADSLRNAPTEDPEMAEAQSREQLATLAASRGHALRADPTENEATLVGSLDLLLSPLLTNTQQAEVYRIVSDLKGIEVVSREASPTGGHDTLVTLHSPQANVSFTLIPATGQLTSVSGLVGDGITTTVESTAILECVHVTGLAGPDTISLACADNNQLITDLVWSNWGAPTATAAGVEWENSCDPSCAEGTFSSRPVTVTVTDRKQCGYNTAVYSRVHVTDPANGGEETFELGCVDVKD